MMNLIDQMQRNWSGLELAWTLAAVIGVFLSSRALARATVLLRAAAEDGMEWPTRRRLYKRVRDSGGAYLRHIGFLLIGIAAMAAPAPPRNPDVDVTPGLVAAAVFITVIVMDVVFMKLDEDDWLRIVRALMRDPSLWDRLVRDEERVNRKLLEQMHEDQET